MPWHLYVIRTVDHTLYAGVTTDVARRFREHLRQGHKTARYLRAHKPKELVFAQEIGDQSMALKAEYWFKRLSRSRKERVIRAGRLDLVAGAGWAKAREASGWDLECACNCRCSALSFC